MVERWSGSVRDLIAHGRRELIGWEQGLRRRGVPVSRLLLCGSLRTGLFFGPKPARFSNSPQPPPESEIIEVDVRIVVAAGTDPRSAWLLAAISKESQARLAAQKVIIRWEMPVPCAYLYRHDVAGGGVALEWEITVNCEPYFETAPFWRLVFSSPERECQRTQRAVACRSGAFSREEYEALKTVQAREFRWRLCNGLALLDGSQLPIRLARLQAQVRAGLAPPTLERGVRAVATGNLHPPNGGGVLARLGELSPLPEYRPAPPGWVTLALRRLSEGQSRCP